MPAKQVLIVAVQVTSSPVATLPLLDQTPGGGLLPSCILRHQ